MIKIDLKSGIPIYEQIIEEMKYLMFKGVLKEDDQLPTVRELSSKLAINPNTIQKAYRELERQGYIYSVRGRGNFVGHVDDTKKKEKINAIKNIMAKQIEELIYMGISRDAIRLIIERLIEEREDSIHDTSQ